MDSKQIAKASNDQLTKGAGEARAELRDLRFRIAAGQLKDVRSVRELRKTVARIQTRLTQLAAAQ